MRFHSTLYIVVALMGCQEPREPFTAHVINPDEGCRRDVQVDGPPDGVCDDLAVLVTSDDGTCWSFRCRWEGMPYEQGTGGTGMPDDPDWCSDDVWFIAQPACSDTDAP